MTREKPPRTSRAALCATRVAFALVFSINVHCALSFVLWPDAYAMSYELSGVPGAAAVRGLGIAFLMWNATYPAVVVNPRRFRALGVVAIVQQAIGLVGETWLRASLPAGHATLAASIERFIAFDAAGLALMAAALAWLAAADRAHARESARQETGTQNRLPGAADRAHARESARPVRAGAHGPSGAANRAHARESARSPFRVKRRKA